MNRTVTVLFTVMIATIGVTTYMVTKQDTIISPIGQVAISKPIRFSPTVHALTDSNVWEGEASYYSREGCIGCSPSLTMANGEPLDDSRLTVAFNRLPLNSYVEVRNKANGQSIVAKVTDTGGFERHGRIIDLSVGTKEAIGCGDLCSVFVTGGKHGN